MTAQYTLWMRNWTFCPGSPSDGWQNARRDGVTFRLDACIDLDKLFPDIPVPNSSEGVLYADFATEGEGDLCVGLGCNWCMETYCDGKLIISTYESGNGQTYVFPNNHRVIYHTTSGNHLLAIRVKRGEDNWNFACGYLTPDVPPEPELEYGPWLTNPDSGAMTVAFSCKSPLAGCISYRKAGDSEWTSKWNIRQGQCLRRTYHAIRLENLIPGAEYEYRILTLHPDKFLEVQLGPTHHFTAPDSTRQTYSFFFTADLQFPLDKQHEIFGKMLTASDAASCDMFILAGDVNSSFQPHNVIAGPFAQLCEYGADSKPIIYVRGNHEMRGNYGDQFLDFFATAIGTTYDILRLGDTAFLLLDSWEDKPAKTPGHTYCQWNLDELFIQQETEWLKSAMQASKWTSAKRKIVICHGAAYSHHDGCHTIPFVLQKMTDPYFEGLNPLHRLNMWLTGHVHHHMRSIPGTDEIASESEPRLPFKGGKSYVYPVLTVGGPSARRIQASCFRVDADKDGFRVKSYDDQGELLEDVRYENDGTCTEFKSFPHFTVPPSLEF